jgi:teichuronic acid biosynthesis glycosyltransferase TuaC
LRPDRTTGCVLVFSSLFPSRFFPGHGMFVAELCRAMARYVPIRVIAPVNGLWQWRSTGRFPRRFRSEDRMGSIPVESPLFFAFPRFWKTLDAFLLAGWTRRVFERAIAAGGVRLVHAHYAYPEATAAVRLGRKYGIPVAITVHGTDINGLARDSARRFQIRDALRRADAAVAVSRELRRKVNALAGPGFHAWHIPNGVSLDRFSPGNREAAKRDLGLDPEKRYILGVGRLEPVKAYDRLLESLRDLPESIHLVLAGDGFLRDVLRERAISLGLSRRVIFPGAVPHERLVAYYRAAELLVIGSHSEGWPTVILESLACGTPVVAHAVGGIPEALNSPGSGILLPDNSPETLARGIRRGLDRKWDADLCVEYASRFTWDRIATDYLRLFESLSRSPRRAAP